MEKQNWIIIGVAVLIAVSLFQTAPKEAVADVNGMACTTNDECVCWGALDFATPSGDTNAYGVGISTCVSCASKPSSPGCNTTNNNGPFTAGTHCDTTWCYDVEPVSDWVGQNWVQWLKENPMWLLAGLGVIALLIMSPRRG